MNDSNDPLGFLDEPQIYKPTNRLALPKRGKLPPLPLAVRKKSARRLSAPLIAACAVAGFVALALVGKGLFSSAATSADQEAVKTYLREHLNAGKWEAVRWWPAKSMDKCKAEVLVGLRNNAKEARGWVQMEKDYNTDMARDYPRQQVPHRTDAEIAERVRARESLVDQADKSAGDFARAPAPRVLRLKYRTLGAFDHLCDEYFEIKDGKAAPAPPYCCDATEFPE